MVVIVIAITIFKRIVIVIAMKNFVIAYNPTGIATSRVVCDHEIFDCITDWIIMSIDFLVYAATR